MSPGDRARIARARKAGRPEAAPVAAAIVCRSDQVVTQGRSRRVI